MLARIASTTLVGIDALAVEVEVDVATGLPGYHVVGLPAPPVKEGAVRIRSALETEGRSSPPAQPSAPHAWRRTDNVDGCASP
jgi:magnesium chelatase family protein